jgi:hypothetical protein
VGHYTQPAPCLANEGELEHAKIAGKSGAFYPSEDDPYFKANLKELEDPETEFSLSVRKRRCIPTDSAMLCQLCKLLSVPCSLTIRPPEKRRIHVSHPIENTVSPKDDGDLASSPQTGLRRRSSFPIPSVDLSLSSYFKPSSLIPTKPLLTELVDLYFRLIHNAPHTLFHESSFLSKLESEQIPELVLLGMMALSARYVSKAPASDIFLCTTTNSILKILQKSIL